LPTETVIVVHPVVSLRVEVSLFVLSPEIEDRDEVEVTTGRKEPRIIIFYFE
jgi:hypothetical protein